MRTRVQPVIRPLSGMPCCFMKRMSWLMRNAAVLAAGDPIAAQGAGVEPFADGSGRDVADFGDLTGGEDILGFRAHINFSHCVPAS